MDINLENLVSSEIVNLLAVGDIMLGDHPVCYGHGVRSTIEKNGFGYIAGSLRDYISRADVAFGNLESVLSDHGLKEDDLSSAELRGRSEDSGSLSDLGFNLLNLANNHAMQHGQIAFDETVRNLRDNDIDVIGLVDAGCSNVVVKSIKNIELLFIGYSLRPEKYRKNQESYARSDEENILKQIRKIKDKFNGHIILSLHWGEEYLNYPSVEQIIFGRRLIDAGVLIILGHHPHVLQGIEEYNDGCIVYSLGNFIFDKWQRNPRESIIFSCEIAREGLVGYEYVPILISRKLQVCFAGGKDREEIERNIEEYNNKISEIMIDRHLTKSGIESYNRDAKNAYLRFRYQSYLYFLLHLYKYRPAIVFASMLRSIKRRIGVD